MLLWAVLLCYACCGSPATHLLSDCATQVAGPFQLLHPPAYVS